MLGIDVYSVLVTKDGLATPFTEVRSRRQRMPVETRLKFRLRFVCSFVEARKQRSFQFVDSLLKSSQPAMSLCPSMYQKLVDNDGEARVRSDRPRYFTGYCIKILLP